MTTVWDKSGACIECGYMPFQLTTFCMECDETKQKEHQIAEMENGLHNLGVQYCYMNDISIPLVDQEQYEILDKKLREYKHLDYTICPWSKEKIYYPQEQLRIRIDEFCRDKYCLNIYNGTPFSVPSSVQWQPLPINKFKGKEPTVDCPISNLHQCKEIPFDAVEDITEEEVTHICEEDDEEEEDFEVTTNLPIDEDLSSYSDLFGAYDDSFSDTESVHIAEDNLYRRFIKDVALGKFKNLEEITDMAKKIKKIIIDPNDGAWESCRWYA